MKVLFSFFALSFFAPLALAEKLNCVVADPKVYYRIKYDTATGVLTYNDFPNSGQMRSHRGMRFAHVGGKDFQLVDNRGQLFATLNLGWGGFDFYENPRKTSYPYYIKLYQLKKNLVGGCASDKHPTYKSN